MMSQHDRFEVVIGFSYEATQEIPDVWGPVSLRKEIGDKGNS